MKSHNVFKPLKFLGTFSNLPYVQYSFQSINGQFLKVNVFYLQLCFPHSKLRNLLSHRRCQCVLVCWVSLDVQFYTHLLPSRPQAASASVTHTPHDLEWQRILRGTWYHQVFWTFVIITEFLCQLNCSLLQVMSSCGMGLLVSCTL